QCLDLAFSKKFGYVTACPTNVGTGIRVSVMLHLPALRLTGEIEKVRRAAKEMHLAVRGMFGEGSDALGDLYQISNQTTLGRSEQELIKQVGDVVQGEPGRLRGADESQVLQGPPPIVTVVGVGPSRGFEEPDPLVVANRRDRNPGGFGFGTFMWCRCL
ncbi:MAG: hypothetical protein IID38_02170, partial [Planctomycetes bacterium]|nr:hypothetical protein [Planctomycetota bacterium]